MGESCQPSGTVPKRAVTDMSNGSGTPGRPPDVPTSEIRVAIRDADMPVLSTKELADEVGLSTQAINHRMDDILAEEDIRSKEVGRTRVFWHKNIDAKETWARIGVEDSTEPKEPEVDPTIGVSKIDDLDLGGQGETLKLRRAAVYFVYQTIRAAGKVRSRFLRLLIWNYPFTQAYASKHGFWNNVISPSLSEFDDVFFEKQPNAWYTTEGKQQEIREQRRQRGSEDK